MAEDNNILQLKKKVCFNELVQSNTLSAEPNLVREPGLA